MVEVPFIWFFGVTAVAFGMLVFSFLLKKITDYYSPFLAMTAGIIWLSFIVTTDVSTTDYLAPIVHNSTMTRTGNSTHFTEQTEFTYVNSTGQLTDKPDYTPVIYDFNNSYTKVYLATFALMYIVIGVFQLQQNKKGGG